MVNDRRTGALGDLKVLPDEFICEILTLLSIRDIARLSCVSSVMYIFCNEEPLWMNLSLRNVNGLFEYKGSWKRTALQLEKAISGDEVSQMKPLHFDGFYSLFLYRRLYRSYTTLHGFYVDSGNVERKDNLSLEEFRHKYDGVQPVLLTGLADTWPARSAWTLDKLVLKYGDTPFRISQRSPRKIKMKLKDYVSYIKLQHDEDPLYIFDEKFGETAPDLLQDYDVPDLFQEDFFDVLDKDQRPPFRWLIIGPERSGASWHVDPNLTSAWNTLLCGCKRWALYPPGKVPLGVTVHVNEEDGDVNIDAPSSLQWWLDFYPFLPDEDKPIECTQLPGETIFVPSGWWHCVLNLEPTVAVTQNFVNTTNFEFVCLDMAPGFCHKGVCRAGFLAMDEERLKDVENIVSGTKCCVGRTDASRREKRLKTNLENHANAGNSSAKCCEIWNHEFSYNISFLSKLLDENRDHYNSIWCSSNCIGQREMREWLWRLWIRRPRIRDLIWKGACLAVNVGHWYECLGHICKFHNLPSPKDDEKLPVGTGSNPVFLTGEYVVKIYVEGGLESSLYCLGTELEFYRLLCEVESPLKKHVPDVLATGFIYFDYGSCTVAPWDGNGVPDVIADYGTFLDSCRGYSNPFGLWSKTASDHRKSQTPDCETSYPSVSKRIWPYIVTKRSKGKILAEIRDTLSWENALDLASFLGEQLHNLRMLPFPQLDQSTLIAVKRDEVGSGACINYIDSGYAAVWEIFLHSLATRQKNIVSHLTKWGHPIPSYLIEKAVEYLPDDFDKLLPLFEEETVSWIHSDIMDDNLCLEPLLSTCIPDHANGEYGIANMKNEESQFWKPSHILDFSDLSVGDPIFDLIPIHLDVFRGDQRLLKHLLASYKLPLLNKNSSTANIADKVTKFGRASYRAMCYCILHEENVLGAIFSIWEDLRDAKSWEEVEEKVWGPLNEYTSRS